MLKRFVKLSRSVVSMIIRFSESSMQRSTLAWMISREG